MIRVITADDASTLPAPAIDVLETGREYQLSELTWDMLVDHGGVAVEGRPEALLYLDGREGYLMDEDGDTHWVRGQAVRS